MITSLKNDDGLIYAFCEWRLVGKSGYDMENGEYIWVNDMWVHPKYRGQNKVSRIIDEIMRDVPQAQYCYFQRKAVNNKVHMYSRRSWERRRNAYDSQLIKEK